jgi:very-short-patch-repair endonuclease
VLSLVSAGAESPMETRLRLLLVRAGLPAPELQHRLHDDRGVALARLDLAYEDRKVGIEYDGGHHRDTFERDLARQNVLHSLGWTILRFTADDVLRHPARTAAQVRAVLSCKR